MNACISVITVCYNAESVIEKTLKSVLEQNYTEIEYIIKDGGSSDKTNEIIDSYKPLFQDKGILLKHFFSADEGIYDAMNIAVRNCNGEWVIFMNSGDMFYNYTVLSDVFQNRDWSNSDVVYGHTFLRMSKKRGYITNHSAKFLEEGMSLCHQSLFMRRELILKFPFNCKYKIKADYEQLLRIKRNGYIFAKINLIISDRNKNGISNEMVALCNKEDNMLKEQYNLKWERKSVFWGYIKQLIKKSVPRLAMIWNIRKRENNIIKYKEE